MERMIADIRFALRTLWKRPGVTVVAIATLALGVGANTAVFSVIRSVLIQPLPYSEPGRVANLWSSWVGWEQTWLSGPELVDYMGLPVFSDVGGYGLTSGNLTGGDRPERVAAAGVTASLFPTLGVPAAVGRVFGPDEDVDGADGVVVLSDGLWRSRYAADPGVVGEVIEFNGVPRTVVGVMPPNFRLPEDYRTSRPTQLWVPLALDPADPGPRGSHGLYGAARLAPGVTAAQASAELARLNASWVEDGLVPAETEFRTLLAPVEDEVLGDVRTTLWLLLGAVGLVLLIACANVANLLIAASDGRRREIAVREALGADRNRIIRQLFTESVVLAMLGGIAGLAIGYSAISILGQIAPDGIPRVEEIRLDSTVLAFALLLSLAASLLFGIGPSLLFARAAPSSSLREGGRSASGGLARSNLRRALIVGEVALAMVLVIGAGLMIRSVRELYRVDLGFQPADQITMTMSLPASDYPESDQVTGYFAELTRRVREIPGVEAAGAARILPLTATMGDWSIVIEGEADFRPADWQVVTPGYVEAAGLSLIRGRTLREADRADAVPVAMISETMADEYWPGQDPVGARFQMGGPQGAWFTVVGILRDVRQNAVVEDARTEMYIPHEQFALNGSNPPRSMSLVVRTDGRQGASVMQAIRAETQAIDPDVPVADVRGMNQIVAVALGQPRFTMMLLSAFAALALSLAAIGIYGVISYSVVERRKEMGIRLALGAEAGRVMRSVMAEGVGLSVLGVLAGLVAALLLTRLLSSLLYGVGTTDPMTYLAVAGLLPAIAVLAAWLPAWRATRIDPIETLRADA